MTGRTRGLETLVTAGPPCPAFSRILEGRGGGRKSPEGHKFQEFYEFLGKVEEDTGTLRFMVESVVPHDPEDAKHFEKLLGANALSLSHNTPLAPQTPQKCRYRQSKFYLYTKARKPTFSDPPSPI